MLPTIVVAAGLLAPVTAFVAPQAAFNGARVRTSSALSGSSLRMAEEPLGVGVIGCGRIGDVSAAVLLLRVAVVRLYVNARKSCLAGR